MGDNLHDGKASFFLENYRTKTLGQLELRHATPSKLCRKFKKFGLTELPDMLEDVENNISIFHEGENNHPFGKLVDGGVYEVPFEGTIKEDEPRLDSATSTVPPKEAPHGPSGINNADIQRALVCCTHVYGESEEAIQTAFNDNLVRHNFDIFTVSKYGEVRYLLAARGGRKEDEDSNLLKDVAKHVRKRTQSVDEQPEVFIAFKGTTSFEDVLTDIKAYQLSSEFEGRFHAGFYGSAKHIPVTTILQKFKKYKIVVCGHSMGGAIAQIIALQMQVQLKLSQDKETSVRCITFGAPFVASPGVTAYVERYGMTDAFLSIVNQKDPVPRLLMLAEMLQVVTQTSKEIIRSGTGFLTPLLQALSYLSIPYISPAASAVDIAVKALTTGIDKLDTFMKENAHVIRDFGKVYSPFGWFLFTSPNDRRQESGTIEWDLEYICNIASVTNNLSQMQAVTESSIGQHAIQNYNMMIVDALHQTQYESMVKQPVTGSKPPRFIEKERRVDVEDMFPLTVTSIKLFNRGTTSGDATSELNVVIKGENLSFFCLADTEFKGVPCTNDNIRVNDCSKNRIDLVITILRSGSEFHDQLVIEIATHFTKKLKEVPRGEIKKIKALTSSEALYDGLNPMMLMKAYERGIAQVALMTKNKKAAADGRNGFLGILYFLEMFAYPRKKDISKTVLWEIVKKATGDRTLKLLTVDVKRARDICEKIIVKAGSHVKVDVEWGWADYAKAVLLGLSGIAGLAAAGVGGALFIGGVLVAEGLGVGLAGGVTFAGAGIMNFFFYRNAAAKYVENYKGVLRTFIEELPDVPNNKELKDLSDLQDVIKLEEILFKQCVSLHYCYYDVEGNLIWHKTEDILLTEPFEDSQKFNHATKSSKIDVFRHIEMCTRLCFLRQMLMKSCFVAVVGLQDAGKSTMIRRTWNLNVDDIGFQTHTVEPILHRITSRMTILDFPGTSDLRDEIANTFVSCGIIASFFIYVMPFNGDPCKIQAEELKRAIPFNSPILICINQCGRYSDAFVDRNATDRFKESYDTMINGVLKEVMKEEAQGDAKLPDYEVMFTDFVDLTDEMEARGLKGIPHVRKWMFDWLVEHGIYEDTDPNLLTAVGNGALK